MLRINGHPNVLCGCLSGLLLLSLACDAPRDNPLDPKNPDYRFGTIQGSVQTFALPHRPVAAVDVTWRPDNRTVRSDALGRFVIDDILPRDGVIYISAGGYRSDSMAVQWDHNKTAEIECYLNRIPTLQQIAVYSAVLNRYPNLRTYQLTIQAWIEDPDLDVETVSIDAPAIGLQKFLTYNPGDKVFQEIFSPYDLGLTSLQMMVGRPLALSVTDLFGFTCQIGECSLKRVILDEVGYIAPASYQVTASRPILQWKKFQPGYAITYTLEVYTDEIVPERVWEKKNLSGDLTESAVDKDLPAGDYFWVIWCVDEFGNRSRSKPASFTVP